MKIYYKLVQLGPTVSNFIEIEGDSISKAEFKIKLCEKMTQDYQQTVMPENIHFSNEDDNQQIAFGNIDQRGSAEDFPILIRHNLEKMLGTKYRFIHYKLLNGDISQIEVEDSIMSISNLKKKLSEKISADYETVAEADDLKLMRLEDLEIFDLDTCDEGKHKSDPIHIVTKLTIKLTDNKIVNDVASKLLGEHYQFLA